MKIYPGIDRRKYSVARSYNHDKPILMVSDQGNRLLAAGDWVIIRRGSPIPVARFDSRQEALDALPGWNTVPFVTVGEFVFLPDEETFLDFDATERADDGEPPVSYPCFGMVVAFPQDSEGYYYLYPERLASMRGLLEAIDKPSIVPET